MFRARPRVEVEGSGPGRCLGPHPVEGWRGLTGVVQADTLGVSRPTPMGCVSRPRPRGVQA